MLKWVGLVGCVVIAVAFALLQVGYVSCRSYPETFVQSSSSCDTIEPCPSLKHNYGELWEAVLDTLRVGWENEPAWEIDVADKDRGYIRTAWRYGYSCYRFGDYRRRIVLQFERVKEPVELCLRTEAERKKRTAEVLWWGGRPVGWIKGYDPAFQEKVHAEMSSRLAVQSP
ncbi:MAG: hypothetical protein JSV19_09205 [Phycisphaerales bacterium]|nr:MAG: hypothetical protein JSV19_09205 [Phycisphaerales bacterium]